MLSSVQLSRATLSRYGQRRLASHGTHYNEPSGNLFGEKVCLLSFTTV